ncbi:MAG: hypothetical protein JSV79_14015 [Armatimonadota bacterium]|nr:MAG: hypothetical protein JSV79_14015 [Armatimonadota bacterium]
MGVEIFLLLVSFVIIVAGAELFTNAVEWLRMRLNLSEGTVWQGAGGGGDAHH